MHLVTKHRIQQKNKDYSAWKQYKILAYSLIIRRPHSGRFFVAQHQNQYWHLRFAIAPSTEPEKVWIAIVQRLVKSCLHFNVSNELAKRLFKARISDVIEGGVHDCDRTFWEECIIASF